MKNKSHHLKAARVKLLSAIKDVDQLIDSIEENLDVFPEPVSYYDSPGVSPYCQKYIKFINNLKAKKTKTDEDLEYLCVYELNFLFAYSPNFFLINQNTDCINHVTARQLGCKNNKSAETYINLALYEFAKTRNYKKALKYINKIPPEDETFLSNAIKLKIYYINEKYDYVIKVIDRLCTKKKTYTDYAHKAVILAQRGMANQKLGRAYDAIFDYFRVINLIGACALFTTIHWNMAVIMKENKKYEKCKAYLDKIIKIKESKPNGQKLHYIKEFKERIELKIKT